MSGRVNSIKLNNKWSIHLFFLHLESLVFSIGCYYQIWHSMLFIQEIEKIVIKIIFRWCLNMYYSMILSRCYYKSPSGFTVKILQWMSMFRSDPACVKKLLTNILLVIEVKIYFMSFSRNWDKIVPIFVSLVWWRKTETSGTFKSMKMKLLNQWMCSC